MSKKFIFKLLTMVMTIIMLCTVTVFAVDIQQARWRYMDMGETFFAEGDNPGEVWISGVTYGYRNCDEIGVTIHLQKAINGQWITILSATYISEGQSYSDGGRNAYVEGGYNYRAISDHWVRVGDVYESCQSETAQIYILKY